MEKEVRLIQSIQRAFNIIDCFNNDNTELSLPQISEKVKLHINTTRGIVNTLVANGYLACNAEIHIALGWFILQKRILRQEII